MESAHKASFYKTSDFLLYSSFVISFLLEYTFPTFIPVSNVLLRFIGGMLLCIAWAILISVKIQFKKHKQKAGPGEKITHILSSGIFLYSRNPIYIAVALILFSLGIIMNSIWMIFFTPILMLALCKILIIPEEKFLINTFNNEYVEYSKKVRRWL